MRQPAYTWPEAERFTGVDDEGNEYIIVVRREPSGFVAGIGSDGISSSSRVAYVVEGSVAVLQLMEDGSLFDVISKKVIRKK